MQRKVMFVIENDANDSTKQAELSAPRLLTEWVMVPRHTLMRLLDGSQAGDHPMRARRSLRMAEPALATLGEVVVTIGPGDQPKDPPDDEGVQPQLIVEVMAPGELVPSAQCTLRGTRTGRRSRQQWHTRASAHQDTGTLAMKADVLGHPPETSG